VGGALTQFSRVEFFSNVAVLFCIGLALFLLISSLRKSVPGPRLGWLAILPLALGGGLAVGVFVLAGDRLAPLQRAIADGSFSAHSPALAVPFALAVMGLGALLGELALVVFPERVANWWGRRASDRAASSTVAVSAAAFLVSGLALVPLWVTTLEVEDQIVASRLTLSVSADHPLPQPPMDLEMVDADTGYLTTATGSILRIALADDSSAPNIDEVADGLSFPRGIAASSGVLFVADLGAMTCPEPFPTCKGSDVAEEMAEINASSGVLLKYRIDPDGSLASPTQLLNDLPVVNSEHGPNGVEVGPDGLVYLSIGNVDKMWEQPDEIESLTHVNRDLMGTILQIDPDTGERSIYASGTRNVYGFDFAPNGEILAVDNDGPTLRGAYPESILAVFGGEDFGYPWGGAGVDRTKTAPLWTLDVHGTSAVEFLDEGPGSPGLLLGGPDRLTYVPLVTDGEQYFLSFVEPVVDVLDISGYVTAIELTPDGEIVIGISSIYGGAGNRLMVLSASGT
jgi:hypothetical protein